MVAAAVVEATVALLNRAVRNARAMMRGVEWGDSSIPPNSRAMMAGSTPGGVEAAALGISTVLSCVKALHDDVKAMPFAAYQGDRFGAHQIIKNQPQVVREPFGPDMEPEVGFGQIVASLSMRGNAIALAVDYDPENGLPNQLQVLHPDTVQIRRNYKTGAKEVKLGTETLKPWEYVHITGLMMPGGVEGVDVVTAQRVNLDLAYKVAAYADGFFGSGGSPSGVISVPGPGNRKRARDVLDAWQSSHGGVANAHTPAVMFGGAKWSQLSVTPDNAQFLATRGFMREEICGWFGVPLQRIQAITDHASQGGGKGLDALDAGYVKHGLLPVARSIEIIWDQLIAGGPNTFSMFDFDTFLRADAITRAQVAQFYRVSGVRLIDEIRADEGWGPLPDGQGQNPFQPLNSNTTSPIGGTDNAPAPGGQE